MKRTISIISVTFLAAALWASPVLINSPETWGSDESGWQYSSSVGGTIEWSADGSLLINTGSGFDPLVSVYANADSSTVSGPGTGKFQGNYAAWGDALTLKFKLNSLAAPNELPGSLTLYFISSNNDKWVFESKQKAIFPGFQDYTYNIGGLTWLDATGHGGIFLSDFTNVKEFGLELTGTLGGSQYKLDEFYLTVPEPETVWMILMVLGSLGITFRSRLMELAGQVKARIRA